MVEGELRDGTSSTTDTANETITWTPVSSTIITGFYGGDADEEDSDGAVYDGIDGNVIPFSVFIDSQGPGASTVETFMVNYDADLLTIDEDDITLGAGNLSIDMAGCTQATAGDITCPLNGSLTSGANQRVDVPATVVNYGADDSGSTAYTNFDITTDEDNDASISGFEEQTSLRQYDEPFCADFSYFASTTRAQLQTQGYIETTITCADSDGGNDDLEATGGFAGSTGTVTNRADMDSNVVTVRYTPSPATLADPNGVIELFELTLTDDEGQTTVARVYFNAMAQADLATTVGGPTSVEVPAGGTTATYTASITNQGVDPAKSAVAYFVLPTQSKVVSGMAGGSAVTCVIADQSGGPDPVSHAWACPSGSLAAGASRSFSITVRFAAGEGAERKLTLPASFKVDITGAPSLDDNGITVSDPNNANDGGSVTTSLTAAVSSNTPTSGSDTITGSSSRDVIAGGKGNDKLNGAGGNDKLNGDAGSDTLIGGSGLDQLFGGSGNDNSDGGTGDDSIYGGTGNDTSSGGTGEDKVSGGPGNDTTRGGGGNDTVTCGTGRDSAFGDSGNDAIGCRDGVGNDTIVGGKGRDTCIGDVGDRFIGCERIFRG